MKNGLLAREIIEMVPGLKIGNFWYWVRYKAKIDPVGERRVGRQIADVYDPKCIQKIKNKMRVK